MTPTKLLIGQLINVFPIIIAGFWASTQWAAMMLGYQVELGNQWFWFPVAWPLQQLFGAVRNRQDSGLVHRP